jgi:hypothetical protein
MKLQVILILVFSILFNCLHAQKKDKLIIAETIDRGDYYYIPLSALSDSVHGICYQSTFERKVNPATRPFKFYWISVCNDGYYSLVITPEQVFFCSSHDNPNPDYLSWVIDIDSVQFRQIQKGIQQKPPKGFENLSKYNHFSQSVYFDKNFKDDFLLPNEWTDSSLKKFETNCTIQIKKQLDRYFAMLNSYITDPQKKISVPGYTLSRKYFSYSKRIIRDWLPVSFKAPENNID